MRRRALGGEVDTVGSLQLDLKSSCARSAFATAGQLVRPTCSSVVEVLVDELETRSQQLHHGGALRWSGKHTSLEAFAMSLKAGGGTLATSFCSTKSAMMEEERGEEGRKNVELRAWMEGTVLRDRKTTQVKACAELRGVAASSGAP